MASITAYIGLGSNMGNSEEFLAKALQMITDNKDIKLVSVSPVYITEPQGIKEQNWFHNQVARIECNQLWTAHDILDFLHDIEDSLGRVRSENIALQQGPRCIDMDLLLFGTERYTDPMCMVPHPQMMQRAFVLIPLRDIVKKDILPFDIEYCLEQIEYKLDGNKIYQS